MLFLHGIFGQGNNLRSVAKRYVAARPDVAAVLVDLRLHGESQEALPLPHTVEAAARDLLIVCQAVQGIKGAKVTQIFGHSFGGKVALAALALWPFAQAWIVDSTPSARPDGRGSEATLQVLSALRALAGRSYGSRKEFEDAFLALGPPSFDRPLAQWLAMSLGGSPGTGLRWRLDLDGIAELLKDYFRIDLWDAVWQKGRESVQVNLVVGGKSSVFLPEDRKRGRDLALAHPEQVGYCLIPEAGHFVHVDQPEELLRCLLQKEQP